jgi:hypothetical protein
MGDEGADHDTRRRAAPARACLAASMLVLLALAGAPQARAAGFCEEPFVRDYAQPLSQMPPLRRLPDRRNDLPFGPAGLVVANKSNPQRFGIPFVQDLRPETKRVGFSLVNEGRGGTPRLDWTVVASLERVSRRARTSRLLASHSERVVRMAAGGERRFLFRLPAGAALYRLTIEFRTASGRRLGRFGTYMRVLAPRLNTRLGLNATTFIPGQTVSACLENFGTVSLFYGLGHLIEHFDGSTWSRAAIDPPRSRILIGLIAGPGAAARLEDFAIPADAPPGLYRWVWSGKTWDVPKPGAPVVRTAEFQILPAP